MDPKHKKILRKNRTKLEEDLEVDDIWSQLISDELFVPSEYEEMSKHNRKSIANLLDKIEQKGEKAFHIFIKAVSESGKAHLLECLNDDKLENEEPQKPNEEKMIQNDTDSEFITVKKEFQEEVDDSHTPIACLGNCTDVIGQLKAKLDKSEDEKAQLQMINQSLNKKLQDANIQIYNLVQINSSMESHRVIHNIDNKIMAGMMQKHKIMMAENAKLSQRQYYFLSQNTQLMRENTSSIMNHEMQNMKMTQKRCCNHDGNECQKIRKTSE